MYIYFSKNRVIHQLEEIFLKGVFSHLSLSGVEVNVLLQPWSLVELNPSVDIFLFIIVLHESIVCLAISSTNGTYNSSYT